MNHLGDITKISGYEVPIVDVVVGGSPCQDLSVAGKREGLAGERSGLFMEQLRIIKEMRDGVSKELRSRGSDEYIRPRYMVWENVPGAFSSNKGEDFRVVLEETARVADKTAVIPRPPQGKWNPSGAIMGDGWSIAWRVHDAQFWGVPQRRKRIALVADFGGSTAPKILFEREGVSGDFEESGEARKGTTTDAERGIRETISFQERGGKPGGGKGILIQNERTGALSTLNNQSVAYGFKPQQGAKARGMGYQEEIAPTLNTSMNAGVMCLNDQGGQQMSISEDVSGTLRAEEHGHQPVVYGISAYESNAMKSANPHSGVYEADTARTLDLNGGSPACNQGGMMIVQGIDGYNQQSTGNVSKPLSNAATDSDHVPIVCIEGNGSRPSHRGDGYAEMGHDIRSAKFTDDEITDPLTATDYKDPIKINDCRRTYQDITGTLDCGIAKGTGNQLANSDMFIANTSVVRRLTPLSCERLQGYPDGWTNIGEWVDSKGKKHKDADSPRYKALGNSIALPFWEWMAKRMRPYLGNNPTMASLFDGIGGFPLVFTRAGFTPVWASEIEEFPMAVTKLRFPSEEE